MSDEELKPRLKRLDYHMVKGKFGGTQLKVRAEPIKHRIQPLDPEIRKALDSISESYLELTKALGRIKAYRRRGLPLNLRDLDIVEKSVRKIIVLVEDCLASVYK